MCQILHIVRVSATQAPARVCARHTWGVLVLSVCREHREHREHVHRVIAPRHARIKTSRCAIRNGEDTPQSNPMQTQRDQLQLGHSLLAGMGLRISLHTTAKAFPLTCYHVGPLGQGRSFCSVPCYQDPVPGYDVAGIYNPAAKHLPCRRRRRQKKRVILMTELRGRADRTTSYQCV